MKLEHLGSVLFSLIKISLPWLFVIVVIALVAWQSPHVKQPHKGVLKSDLETTLLPGLSTKQITHLIERAAPNVRHSPAWSTDLKAALGSLHLESSLENVCAIIAVTNQVSSFEDSPRITGIDENTLLALSTKLAAIPQLGYRNPSALAAWLKHNPSIKNSYWHKLRTAKTQFSLDLTYRKMLAALLALPEHKTKPLQDDPQFRDLAEDNNLVKTIGPMQVAVNFAVQNEEQRLNRALTLKEISALRERMHTRRGGMYFGALLLLGYDGGYDKKLYRFADFNAGRYASRNAGFQTTVAALLDTTLVYDGDLLIYDAQGKPAKERSNSEMAIIAAVKKHQLGLTEEEVHADLLQEKSAAFHYTKTYKTITTHYQKLTHKHAPIAVIPNIVLNGGKNTRGLSTEKFTAKVNERYLECLG